MRNRRVVYKTTACSNSHGYVNNMPRFCTSFERLICESTSRVGLEKEVHSSPNVSIGLCCLFVLTPLQNPVSWNCAIKVWSGWVSKHTRTLTQNRKLHSGSTLLRALPLRNTFPCGFQIRLLRYSLGISLKTFSCLVSPATWFCLGVIRARCHRA